MDFGLFLIIVFGNMISFLMIGFLINDMHEDIKDMKKRYEDFLDKLERHVRKK